MINELRLKQMFEDLVRIDSPSGHEKEVCIWIKNYIENIEIRTKEDNASEILNTESNNLIGYFDGNIDLPPLMLCAHMDTVEPGRGVEPVFENGVFRSKGDTILGADNKSAIAVILEVINVIKENNLKTCPIDLVFTVFEEGGLKGAKAFDTSLIRADFGYIPDSTDPEGIVVSSPSCSQIIFEITGKSAHAGAEPEKGVNAIITAAKALSQIKSGRIDDETTCNIGIIKGGKATNIVPDKVVIKAEARSHDPEKLEKVIETMKSVFELVIKEEKQKSPDKNFPALEIKVEDDFKNVSLSRDEKVFKLADKAAENLGFELKGKKIGGGADANVFFHKGIKAGVIGTGMKNIHTIDENISLKDMVDCAKFLLEIINVYSLQTLENN
ncbi:MAG: M20/M25/M40 family metallo-hydrolase [Desulforegulaceae bacterium]|nr:M20/M25/M40 family metallo-hydrolase [Desulforegulaceae bacterium]